jgi:predicted nucleic acid-binding protein
MSVLLDTNILLRSSQFIHPQRQPASDATNLLLIQGEQLCLVPQNLYEYWVVCTRPILQNGLGLTSVEAAAKIVEHKRYFAIRDDTPAILPEWERLVTQHQVLGKRAHDARLVAAMLVHGIRRILTFNARDFQRYSSIVAITPQEVLQSPLPPASGTQGSVP